LPEKRKDTRARISLHLQHCSDAVNQGTHRESQGSEDAKKKAKGLKVARRHYDEAMQKVKRFLARSLECTSASRNSLPTRSRPSEGSSTRVAMLRRVSSARLKRGRSKKAGVGLGRAAQPRRQGTMRLAHESCRVAEERRCLGDARVSVGRGCLDVGS